MKKRIYVLFAISLMFACGPLVARETSWPENMDRTSWPCKADCEPIHIYIDMCRRHCLSSWKAGQIFPVDRYGAYFFKSANGLILFLKSPDVINKDMRILRASHPLIALQTISGQSGRVRDDEFGDGFVWMAPDGWYQIGAPFFKRTNAFQIESRRTVAYRHKRQLSMSKGDP